VEAASQLWVISVAGSPAVRQARNVELALIDSPVGLQMDTGGDRSFRLSLAFCLLAFHDTTSTRTLAHNRAFCRRTRPVGWQGSSSSMPCRCSRLPGGSGRGLAVAVR